MPDVYLAIKYHEDHSNRALVERLRAAMEAAGLSSYCVAADLERWGKRAFDPTALMKHTFEVIEACRAVVVEFSEKGVGLGIEAGYAVARGLPVIVVMAEGSDLSATMQGVAAGILTYDKDPAQVAPRISELIGEDCRAT